MFERFSERARRVVILAQDEAARHRHDHVGIEHILLGLVRERDGVAARVLQSLGITAERVRPQVVQVRFAGGVTPAQLPFTPAAKKVLELALREALSLGHNHIRTEHILLGLVRGKHGEAARILLGFDTNPATVRGEVIRMLGTPGGPDAGEPPAGRPAPAADSELPDLAGASLEQLDALIDELIDEEREISYRRRIVHARLDIVWTERENRRGQPPNGDS